MQDIGIDVSESKYPPPIVMWNSALELAFFILGNLGLITDFYSHRTQLNKQISL